MKAVQKAVLTSEEVSVEQGLDGQTDGNLLFTARNE
jgi:hypothetical protein